MNDKALATILVVVSIAALAWGLLLGGLFVDWRTAWAIALGSAVFGVVLLAGLYQFAEFQRARELREQAEEDVDDDPAPTKGVQ